MVWRSCWLRFDTALDFGRNRIGQDSPCFLDLGSSFAPYIERFRGQIGPGHDSFPTEAYSAELEAILSEWSSGWRRVGASPTLIHASLSASLLGTLLSKPAVKTLRSKAPIATEQVSFPEASLLSKEAFAQELKTYFSNFYSIEIADVQIAHIEITSENPMSLRTEVLYDVAGEMKDQSREQRTGRWQIAWIKMAPEATWKVEEWTSLRESRARLSGPGFVDVTGRAFAHVDSYSKQMRHGADHWRTVLDGAVGIDVYGNNGIAAGDYDGDGFDDLYVSQAAGLPNRLYQNRGDGTFEDVTDRAGVGVLDATSSALFADLNNNGYQDLIIVCTTGPLLFVNQGNGTFEPKPGAFEFARAPQGTFTAAAIADFNRDGLLDVYFCLYSYYQGLSEYRFPNPYYDAQNGPPNFLMRNRGDYTFEDVTSASGLDQSNNRYSFACGWNDYDQDGWPDLYVVNDFGRKNLYRNLGNGTFADVSAEMAVEDPGAGMSVCWADFDNDGRDDLYVANMWTAEGRRVSEQKGFLPGTPDAIRSVYRKHANGNSLFINEGSGKPFRDATDASGTRMGRWSWSSDSWDFDHDGCADLYVTNGFVSGPDKQNLSSFFWRQVVARSMQSRGASSDYEDAWSAINEFLRSDFTWSGYERNCAYLNNGDGTFTEAAALLGLDCLDDSRSFALADLDHDGRLEIVLKNRSAPQVRVLENRMEPLPASILFSLRGTKSNRDAIGAVVELHDGANSQRKTVAAGSGFLAQHSKSLSFGVGDDLSAGRRMFEATVFWPSGLTQKFTELPSGHHIRLTEGSVSLEAIPFRPRRVSGSPAAIEVGESPDTQGETWLVDPVRAPEFTLTDQRGLRHTLQVHAGRTMLLVFVGKGCEQSAVQLAVLSAGLSLLNDQGVDVLAVRAGQTADSPSATSQIAIADADGQTLAVYGIFYRFLFERRREMPSPAAFLLDGESRVVKVWSGRVEVDEVVTSIKAMPDTAASRLQLASAFPGTYFGKPLHHNFFTYGVAYFRYGFLDHASDFFERAIAKKPDDAGSFYNLGLIALKQNRGEDAKAKLEKAASLDPGNANAWNNLGVAYGRLGDYDHALSSFRQALSKSPGHLLALENEVKLLQFQGKSVEAQAVLEAAIRCDPTTTSLHTSLAMVWVGRNDLQSARREFERGLALEPQNVEALNGLGVVLLKLGDGATAKVNFESCLKLAPSFDRPYLNLALLYMRAGDKVKAREVLAGYLAQHPGSSDVQRALAEVEAQQ